MKITEKLLRPITETSYLTADNVKRYRCIMRFFYLQYERINYWINQEEVLEELSAYEEFDDYTLEQCKQDLKQLVDWHSLMPMQDTKKAASIEAFNNKQFRYQITEYAVEIERMVIGLENLKIEGASLEPTMLERLRKEIEGLKHISFEEPVAIYSWWKTLNADFVMLNQNYQDYMLQLNTAKAEELMKTKAFLIYKDKLIEHLRNFVKGIQKHAPVIEACLRGVDETEREVIFSKLLEYEMSIPRINTEVSKEDIYDRIKGRWTSLKNWFSSEEGRDSEAVRLYDMTTESIRKLTRYAAQISEQMSGGANRREDYKLISEIFARCQTVKEAHCLSSVIFGVERPLHIKGDILRETESINSGVFEEEPYTYELSPRVRNYKEKFERSYIREHKEEKERLKARALEQLAYEKSLMDKYVKDGILDFKSLTVIEPEARNIMLRWLTKALEHKEGKAKGDDGRAYRLLNPEEQERCILACKDGEFLMPAFIIEFEN